MNPQWAVAIVDSYATTRRPARARARPSRREIQTGIDTIILRSNLVQSVGHLYQRPRTPMFMCAHPWRAARLPWRRLPAAQLEYWRGPRLEVR